MSEKTIPGQITDDLNLALTQRNNMDEVIREMDSNLRRAKHDRDAINERAFRLRKALWAMEGKTGTGYSDDHATRQNDRDAKTIRDAGSR